MPQRARRWRSSDRRCHATTYPGSVAAAVGEGVRDGRGTDCPTKQLPGVAGAKTSSAALKTRQRPRIASDASTDGRRRITHDAFTFIQRRTIESGRPRIAGPGLRQPVTDQGVVEPQAWFRRLTFYSVLSGMWALLPVPLLDDHFLRRTRRRMVRGAAARHGVVLSEAQITELAGDGGVRTTWGCLVGVIVATTAKLLRRFVRTVVFFLAANDAADAASRTFHEGYLLEQALAPPSALGPQPRTIDATRVRWAIETTCAEIDTRPIRQLIRRAFRGSRWLLRRGVMLLSRSRGAENPEQVDALEQEQERLMSSLLERLSGALFGQQRYLQDLEQSFRRHLDAGPELLEPPSSDGRPSALPLGED